VNDGIVLVEYDSRWPGVFEAEAARVRAALGGDSVVAVEHIGSTAVPGLAAKPIIDLLVGVTSLGCGGEVTPALEAIGYEAQGEFGIPGRLFFEKRGVGAVRTHHLHMAEPGGEFWTEELLFRDYLRAHPDEARAYERLKRDRARRFRFQRAEYTASKTDYILDVLEKARAERATD